MDHLISHAYKYDVCAFNGENDWNIQIHNGKMHNKKTDFGLYDAKDEEI